MGARAQFAKAKLAGGSTLFAFAEGGYAYRLPTVARLRPVTSDDERNGVTVNATRLGKLDLSGAEWRVGAGIEF